MGKKAYMGSKPKLREIVDEDVGKDRFLVLHNDEYHTFDYVIESLVEICKMDTEQAEQCTYLVHYKGKYDIKRGSESYLKPFKNGLLDRGLDATIS
jgi:ATP-dependent Clp protease adaptor protein ClpS